MERNRIYCILTHYTRKTIFKMLPALILVDFGVFFFYLKKGMAGQKIKATFSVIKNLKKINQKYNQIQKTRKLSDKEIIKNFLNEKIIFDKDGFFKCSTVPITVCCPYGCFLKKFDR